MTFETELEGEDFLDGLEDVRKQVAELLFAFVDATAPKGNRIFKRKSTNRGALEASAMAMELIRGLEQQAREADFGRPRVHATPEGSVPS